MVRKKGLILNPEIGTNGELRNITSILPNQIIANNSVVNLNGNADNWVCDSGASDNMAGSNHYFKSYEALKTPRIVGTEASGSSLHAVGMGNVNVLMTVRGQQCAAMLHDVLYVPGMAYHLFSSRSASKHDVISVDGCEHIMLKRNGRFVATATWKNNAYIMDMCVVRNPTDLARTT